MKSLVLPIVGSLVGALLYLAVTAAVLLRGYKPPAPPPKKPVQQAESEHIDTKPLMDKMQSELESDPPPSWKYMNPEMDKLVNDMQTHADAIRERETQLEALAQRLAAERAELAAVTQSVARMQQDIDQRIIRIQEDEAANVKRLAKTYATMEPASVAKIVAELDEKLVVKILSQMKDDQTALILDAVAKTDAQGARLAASLSDRLRLVPTTKKP